MSRFALLLESAQLSSSSLKCPICQQSFEDSLALRDHIVTELGIQPEFLGFLNIDLGIPPDESKSSELVQCTKCKKTFKGVKGFNQHYGKMHRRLKKHSVCKLCGSAFKNKYILRFHMKQVHSQATKVACPTCGVILYNKYMLPKHIQKMHPVDK